MKKRVLLIVASLALALTSCNLLPTFNQSRRSKPSSEVIVETSDFSSSDSSSYRRSSSKNTSSSSILPINPIERYGTTHEGTLEDPFDNEEAVMVAKSPVYDSKDYYVKGVVASFGNAPGVRTDGMVSFYYEPATPGGEKFEAYKCFKADGSALTDDDIWIGGIATVHGTFAIYNNTQAETASAIFVSCEGEKPVQTIEDKTFAEVLAIGTAYADGEESINPVRFQAYVTSKQNYNYFLTATKGEELIVATSDTAHGEKTYYPNAIELYAAGRVEGMDALLQKDAKIEVTMIIKNYHGTVENGRTLSLDDITVIEEGGIWFVAEPDVINISIGEFLALPNNKNHAYIISGTIVSFYEGETKNDFGTMIITDGINELNIYSCTATDTALYWDNISTYSYARSNDFLTNEITANLSIGWQVTMKLIRNDRLGTVQGVGIIISVD